MKNNFITITGFKHYYGRKPFAIGALVRCEKDQENNWDGEAIRAVMPMIGTVGYVANRPDTVAGGTMSAGRVYDRVGPCFYARVLFTTFTKIICEIEDEFSGEFDREWKGQTGYRNDVLDGAPKSDEEIAF